MALVHGRRVATPNVKGKPSRTRRPDERQTFNEAKNRCAAPNRRLVRVGLTDLLADCSVATPDLSDAGTLSIHRPTVSRQMFVLYSPQTPGSIQRAARHSARVSRKHRSDFRMRLDDANALPKQDVVPVLFRNHVRGKIFCKQTRVTFVGQHK